MLSPKRIRFLADLAELKLKTIQDIPTGFTASSFSNGFSDKFLQADYDEVKKAMDLDDIRFHWLLTEKLFMAGGSVLNWVWGEQTNGDYDFYTQKDTDVKLLRLFIEHLGAKEGGSETPYAKTYSIDNNTDIQIVECKVGTPKEILGGFDLNVCRFAVDCDKLYTTRNAVIDLLSMALTSQFNEGDNVFFLGRLAKYIGKGFSLSSQIRNTTRVQRMNVQWPTKWEEL